MVYLCTVIKNKTMKKSTLLFAASFIGAISFAQTLPNPGFETWVNNTESPHTYSVPQSWITVDALESTLYAAFGDATYVSNSTTQVGSAHGGTSAVQMAVVQSNEGDTVGGGIFSTPSANNMISVLFGGPGALGFPYATRSANLTGFRKTNLIGGDTAAIGVVMTKWNGTSRDTLVNVPSYNFTNNAAAWTSFSIPLTYLMAGNPDTCLIIAGVGGTTPHPGSTFTLDDLAFTGLIGVHEENIVPSSVSVYPNPFNEEATLAFTNVNISDATLEITDVLGNVVRVMNGLNGEDVRFNRDGLINGIYFYRLVNQGEVVATGKLSIQ